MRRLSFLLPLSLFFSVSCTNDAYETGDSRYSYLRTDFVEVQSNSQKQLVSATTDEGMALTFTKPASTSWITTADSTYRALLYYNIGETMGNTMSVEPVSIGRVFVLNPQRKEDILLNINPKIPDINPLATDPVHFQSSWESTNKSYANLSIALMTGVADSIDSKQGIGLLCDSIVSSTDGHHTYYYKLLHSQGNAPQYYKSTIYVSIPTRKMTTGDVVRLSLNTYNGWITREFRL